MIHINFTRFAAALFMSIPLLNANTVFAGDFEDFSLFIKQYEQIGSLQVNANYTYELTIQPDAVSYHNAKASGPYQYLYTNGMTKIHSDLVASDELSQFLELRLDYSFDGEYFYIYDLHQKVLEKTTNTPLLAQHLPMTPALYPVAFLRGDLVPELLLGIEHYQNSSLLVSNIKKHREMTNSDGQPYLLIQLDTDPAMTHDNPPKRSEYHIYMSDSESPIPLPRRIEWWADKALSAVFLMPVYLEVENDEQPLFLPKSGSFIAYENDEAILEYKFIVNSYSTDQVDDSRFVLKPPTDTIATISPDGTVMSADGKSSQLPEIARQSRTILSESVQNTVPNNSIKNWIIGLFIGLLVAGAGIFLYKRAA